MIAIMTSIYLPFIRLLSTPFLISFSFISHFSSGALGFAVGWHDSLSIWYSLIEWKNNNRCIDSRGKSQQVNQNGVAFQSIEIQKCCPHRSKARSVHSWHCVSFDFLLSTRLQLQFHLNCENERGKFLHWTLFKLVKGLSFSFIDFILI